MNASVNELAESMDQRDAADAFLMPDIIPVTRAAFAETFGGFERVFRPGSNDWRWKPEDASNRVMVRLLELNELPAVTDTSWRMLTWLDGFVERCNAGDSPLFKTAVRLVWSIQRTAEPTPEGNALYYVRLASRHAEGQFADIAYSTSEDPGTAVALCALSAAGVNLHRMHRELFPGRYIAQ